jgi:hypothetical protein
MLVFPCANMLICYDILGEIIAAGGGTIRQRQQRRQLLIRAKKEGSFKKV